MSNPVQIGDCQLWLGDCLKILPTLEPVDLVATDPPYLLESGGNSTGEMGGKFAVGTYDNSGEIIPTGIKWEQFMPIIYAAMNQGHAYFMANNRNLATAINEGIKAGFGFHNILVWDKSTGTPNRWYMKNCEFTVFFYKGKAKYINDCGSRQLIKCPNVLNGRHPTEKPVPLFEHYISNSTKPGEIILDPFMGSGTTGVACAILGRKFIGIEKDPEYFKIAVDRIRGACRQGTMFSKNPLAEELK